MFQKIFKKISLFFSEPRYTRQYLCVLDAQEARLVYTENAKVFVHNQSYNTVAVQILE